VSPNLFGKCAVFFVALRALRDPSLLNKMWSQSSQRIAMDTKTGTNGLY